MLDPDADHQVVAIGVGEDFGEVERELGIAGGAAAHVVAVHPDLGVLVDAVEPEPHVLAGDIAELAQRHMRPIPTDAAGQVPRAARIVLGKPLLDAPVVRHRDRSPAGVVKALGPGLRRVREGEDPLADIIAMHEPSAPVSQVDADAAAAMYLLKTPANRRPLMVATPAKPTENHNSP